VRGSTLRPRPSRPPAAGPDPWPALFRTEDIQPSAGAGGSVALEVEDLDGLIARLKGQGVQFKAEMIHSPVCRMSICLDSEGNSIILHQLHPK
jgi:predicted enzyme related to lactoylglutathione lyase